MAKRPTIRDVAALADVSVATVSRVLSGDYPVAGATRTRVQHAVRELNYVVNAHARALSGTTSKVVALVVREVVSPFYARIAAGVEEQATEAHRLCLVCTTHGDPDRELEVIKLMREQQADAVILVGGVVEPGGAQRGLRREDSVPGGAQRGLRREDSVPGGAQRGFRREDSVPGGALADYRERMYRYAQGLEDAGTRLVLCGRPSLGPDFPAISVEYDNAGGAFAATSQLLSGGHRRIAMLAGEPGMSTSDERVDGYRRAMTAFGAPIDPALIRHGWMSHEEGGRHVRELLATSTAFTAIFAANDQMAAGALMELRSAGLRCPEDVSIIGYDDSPYAQDLWPALNSVHVPLEELGRTAVRLALAKSTGAPSRQQVMLGTHVVIRNSVRPLTP